MVEYDAETEAAIDAAGIKHWEELEKIREKEAAGRRIEVIFDTSVWHREEARRTAEVLVSMSEGIMNYLKSLATGVVDDAIATIEAVDVHIESALDSARLTLLDFRDWINE